MEIMLWMNAVLSTFSEENLFGSVRLEKPSSRKLMQGLLQWNPIQNSSMETQNKMFPCYFQALLCHKTQRFQFMFAHINIYALLEVFRYKTKTLLCYGKQIYISRTSYNHRQHKGSISAAYMPRGNSCSGKSNAALQLVAVRYARLIFNLMVDCDSASSSVNPSFLQQYYQVWIRGVPPEFRFWG